MEWINLHAPMLRAPEYIGSEPVSRATWLNVLAYCVEQENGGRIRGGAHWKDRQWQQTCGVMREEVGAANLLLVCDGDDVLVWRYPSDKEAAVREQREAGRRGGRPRKEPSENPRVNPPVIPTLNPPETQPRNGRGREGKEKKNGNSGGGSEEFLILDDKWLDSLQSSEAYKHLKVRVELGKAHVWCEVNHRQCTKRFFTNWLNRASTDTRTIKSDVHTAQHPPVSPHNNNLNRAAVSDYSQVRKRVAVGVDAHQPGDPAGAAGTHGDAERSDCLPL